MQLLKKIKRMFFSGAYDAAKGSTRRGSARPSRRSEDNELDTMERRQLIANARDASRNMALCGWMIRKHLAFVARYKIQFRTGDGDLDERLSDLWEWWSRRENCDIAERHSFDDVISLLERHAVVDGDCGMIKLGNGRVQLIEGDRIATPAKGSLPKGIDPTKITHGVVLNDQGKAQRYIINKRTRNGVLVFERTVAARNFEFHGYFDRADQVRGITRLSPVLSYLRDLRELFEYQLAANKFTSLFGLVFKRQAQPGDPGGFEAEDVNSDGTEFQFDVRGGPMRVEVGPGDEVDTIESKNPAREQQEFATSIIQLTMLALDIPMTFFDSRRSSFSAGRQDMAQYMENVMIKRARLHQVINAVVAWQIGRWSSENAEGEHTLELPAGMTAAEVKWDIISTGVVWVDQMKEVSADALAVASGFKSRQQVCMQQGRDFFNVARQLAAEENLITELGITITIGQPGQSSTRDEEPTNPANIINPESTPPTIDILADDDEPELEVLNNDTDAA